jgi:hypothetical protein
MSDGQSSTGNLHHLFRKADYLRWHRLESRRQILRSQLGFAELTSSRPKPCIGCTHYHGLAYGYSRETRTVLVCGFHPYGWQGEVCPDWQEIS